MPSVAFEAVLDAVTIKQVTSSQWQPNFKSAKSYNSGALAASQISLISGEDLISLTTADLAGVIAGINPSSGLVLSSASLIPYQARAAGGAFQAAGNHHTLGFVNGLVIPMEISATQDSEEGATAKLDVYVAATAGQTYPITINDSATLAAAAFVGAYDLGPVKIGSTHIAGVVTSTVKFGITLERKRYGGEVWNLISGLYIKKIEPILEVTFEDIASMKAAGAFAATATTATSYFRKRVAGGSHVADATATNIACTITGGMHMIQSAGGKEFDNVSLTRQFEGLSWAFSSTSAIT